jgi:hypothetical protein
MIRNCLEAKPTVTIDRRFLVPSLSQGLRLKTEAGMEMHLYGIRLITEPLHSG